MTKMKSAGVFVLSLLMTQGCAYAKAIIYSAKQASQLNTSSKGPFYVQLASFRSATNANRYLRSLKINPDHPVAIVRHGAFYAVEVGPISSASAVRAMRLTDSTALSNATIKLRSPAPHLAEAAVLNHKPQLPTGRWMIGADMGGTFPRPNHTMTVNNGSGFPAPFDRDQYSTRHQNHPIIGIQAGRRWERAQQWIPAYSAALKYQHLFINDLQGSVTQYSLPEFKNYSYHWGLAAEVLSLNGKVDVLKFGRIMPYLDAGLGVSINRARSYREAAYAGITPRSSPAFASHGQGHFYYNAGAGLDAILTSQFIISAGYDYQSFGQMDSGQGSSTWLGERLHAGHFSSNTVLVGITYLMGDSVL